MGTSIFFKKSRDTCFLESDDTSVSGLTIILNPVVLADGMLMKESRRIGTNRRIILFMVYHHPLQ